MKKKIEIDKKMYNINCKVMSMSFSAHVDSKGIMEFLNYLKPNNIMLVHGDKEGMLDLKKKVTEVLKINCLDPENHSITTIPVLKKIPFKISLNLLNYYYANSSLAESDFVIPNVILSDFCKKNKKAIFQTSAEFVYHHYMKLQNGDYNRNQIEDDLDKKMEDIEEDKEEDIETILNSSTRYFRVRVLIKWNQWFFYKSTLDQFKIDLKEAFINKTKINADRENLSTKLEEIFESYITIETREPDLLEESEEPKGNFYVEVCYNLMERKLGELLTSSVKAIITAQNEK